MTDESQTIYAVSYARVSTDDHDQNPESQHVELRKYAKEHGITIVEEFTDMISGTTDERPELQRIFGYKLMHPEVTKLLVLSNDRLARDMDIQRNLRQNFNKIGLEIIYRDDDKFDTSTKEGKLMEAMKSYGAQAYTDGHKLKIKAGLERAKLEGKKLGRPLRRNDDLIKPDMLIEFAKKGYSLRDLQQVYKVSRMTLSRRLEESGRLEEFKQEYENAKIRANSTIQAIDH